MGNFRWDGGAKRKDLDDSCPTDSAVIMHCLATYLDSQLPAFTDRPDRRPFTGQVYKYFFNFLVIKCVIWSILFL